MRFLQILFFVCSFSFSFSLIIVKKLLLNESIERFDDEEALFGPRLTDYNPAAGYLFTADPIDGCSHSIPLPPNASHHAVPFICLIKRGNCNFDDKVRAAERGGYAAAIVFNHLDDSIFPMGSQSAVAVKIPSFMVGLKDGTRFLKFTNSYEDYIFEIYANHKSNIEIYLIPVASLLGLFILGVTCMGIYRWNEQRRRRRRRCLTSSQVSRLPLIKFIKGQTQDGACVICLDDFEDGDKLRYLPCGHTYHTKCIDPWLLKNSRLCPICKRSVCPRSSTVHRRRPLTTYFSFSRRQNNDELSERLVSESDSYGDVDENDEEYSSTNAVVHPPGASYGTVVSSAGRQLISNHSQAPDESTPLLVSNCDKTVKSTSNSPLQTSSHSWHSAPSILDDVARPFHQTADFSQTSMHAVSAPGTSSMPILNALRRSLDLHPSPSREQNGTRVTVDPGDVLVHRCYSPRFPDV